jgi:hypothetical protein
LTAISTSTHPARHLTKTVHEHRAPTDESVRLLREMEQKARDQIIQAIRLEDALIDCVIHAQEDFAGARMEYLVIAKVNGQRIEARKAFDFDVMPDAIAITLRGLLAERIATVLLGPAFGKLPHHLKMKR